MNDAPKYAIKYGVISAEFPRKPKNDLEAIRWSILKWKRIKRHCDTYGGNVENRGESCALCQKYLPTCSGCPIQISAKATECKNTPWRSYANSDDANAELVFLRALLWPHKEKED